MNQVQCKRGLIITIIGPVINWLNFRLTLSAIVVFEIFLEAEILCRRMAIHRLIGINMQFVQSSNHIVNLIILRLSLFFNFCSR